MAGKYQQFRGRVKPFELDPSYQEKVNTFKAGLGEGLGNVSAIARQFTDLTLRKKALEAEVAKLNVGLEGLSQLLVEHLEAEAVQKIELADGALVYLQDTPYPSVTNKEELFDWIKKHKLVNLLTAHHQMLKGMVGELLVKGQPPPPGVAVFLKTQARVRGANGGDED